MKKQRKNSSASLEKSLAQGFVPIEALEKIKDICVFMIDKEEKIICYSKGCEIIEGYKRDEVIGKHPDDLYNIVNPSLSNDREASSIAIASLHEGKSYEGIYDCYRTRNGDEVNILCNTYPLLNEEGETQAVLCTYEEVSDYLNMVATLNTQKSDIKQLHLIGLTNGTQYVFEDIVGNSSALQKCIAQGRIAAATSASVLISGETGTGKEVFAQSIHNASECRDKPFVAVNCSAIPENLIESTLFGTCKGAYTGAMDKRGLFEEAEGGTLFLDEINSMDINIQSKLLRVLETQQFRKVGGVKEISCQVRIISALNQKPFEAIEEKRLREDLYYRLAVFAIDLPTLRDQKEDVLTLAQGFIENMAGVLGKKVCKLAPEVQRIFLKHQWSGNIRELKHVIIQGLYLSKSDDLFLKPQCLPEYLLDIGKVNGVEALSSGTDRGLRLFLGTKEKSYIKKALEDNNYNVSKTARGLSISRENLRNKMKKYDIFRKNEVKKE